MKNSTYAMSLTGLQIVLKCLLFLRDTLWKQFFNGLDTTVFRYIPDSTTPPPKPLVIHVTPNFYDKIKGGQHVIERAISEL